VTIQRRRWIWIAVGIIAALAIAIPVLGADPSPSASPSGQASPETTASPDATASPEATASPAQTAVPEAPKPDRTAEPDATAEPGDQGPGQGNGKPDKADKEPEVDVTVQGTVQQTTDGQGRPAFTLTAAGKTWELSAGPPWFWGDKNPLKAYVGKSVTIAGEAEDGGTELDVSTVNGTAIRAPGKPPWAGGPWVVGPTHPGWKPWMANGKPGKHDKDASATPTPTATP
jgi:cytoskeletal protein RodZ